jgi:signal transduction histidine kinase
LPERDTFSYIVAQLDSEYIRREFIPELAERYFSDGAEGRASEYQLSIISQTDPVKVIYSTASAPLTASEVDASGAMLTLRPQLVENFAFEIASPVGVGTPAPGILAGRRRLDHPGLRAGQRVGPDHSGQPRIALINAASSGPLVAHAPPGFRVERETGSWRLLVNHRAGSLNGAAEKLRRQNLFVSFDILLLLAASAMLIYVSSHRAKRLARQQIEFVAGVSHELRVPVSVLSLTSANLADGLIRDPVQVDRYGRLIHDAVRRLAQSIEQVLYFAGAEMVRKPYQFGEVEVEALVASALDACRAEWQSAGFEVKTTIAKPLPKVWGDRAALGSALQNLISNAVKYSGESRQIEVDAQIVRKPRPKPWPKRRRTEVQIRVEDHGIGIEPADLAGIFEPFKRGAAAAAAQIPGNGLGLYIVRRIAAAHGGEVTVQSAPGQGSVFTLRLPAPFEKVRSDNTKYRMEV